MMGSCWLHCWQQQHLQHAQVPLLLLLLLQSHDQWLPGLVQLLSLLPVHTADPHLVQCSTAQHTMQRLPAEHTPQMQQPHPQPQSLRQYRHLPLLLLLMPLMRHLQQLLASQ
jgi:hypothetical protein